MRPSEAMLDRLERVIETLQDNSVKMGQMLAVHDEKLDKPVSYTHLTLPTNREV